MEGQEQQKRKTKESLTKGSTINVEHPECVMTFQEKKVVRSKKTEKTYTVIVTLVKLTDEDAKMKRGIVESIMKKGYKKKSI